MDVDNYKKFICRINDFVFIEERIVTCLWLCQFLKIHVNTVKQLLHSFIREDVVKDRVLVTYIIGGELCNGEGNQLKLVDGKSREDAKLLFSKITTDHVYSVQKSPSELKPIDIFNSFPHFAVDVEERSLCGIQSSKKIKRRQIKQIVYETKKETPKPPPKQTKPVKKSVDYKKEENSINGIPEQKKELPDKNKKLPVKGKSKGIADLFNKQTEKKKNDSPAEKSEKKVEKKTLGGISGFFQKQPSKKTENEPVKDEPMDSDSSLPIKETNKKVESKEKVFSQNKNEKKRETKESDKKSSNKEEESKGKRNSKKRKKRDEEKENNSIKKRKRIRSIVSSESESSDNEASDVEMDVEPPPVPAPLPDEDEEIIPPIPGRKRVRKLIYKTYTDEDGYILTKKEYVYESCTDDEADGVKRLKEGTEVKEKKDSIKKEEEKDEVETKEEKEQVTNTIEKKSNKKTPKQISPANSKSNKQQPSIMDFFKKT